jgi:hypothetical protein
VVNPDDLEATLRTAISQVEAGHTSVVEVRTARVQGSLYRLWAKD